MGVIPKRKLSPQELETRFHRVCRQRYQVRRREKREQRVQGGYAVPERLDGSVCNVGTGCREPEILCKRTPLPVLYSVAAARLVLRENVATGSVRREPQATVHRRPNESSRRERTSPRIFRQGGKRRESVPQNNAPRALPQGHRRTQGRESDYPVLNYRPQGKRRYAYGCERRQGDYVSAREYRGVRTLGRRGRDPERNQRGGQNRRFQSGGITEGVVWERHIQDHDRRRNDRQNRRINAETVATHTIGTARLSTGI